jgi:hypothetical protein
MRSRIEPMKKIARSIRNYPTIFSDESFFSAFSFAD